MGTTRFKTILTHYARQKDKLLGQIAALERRAEDARQRILAIEEERISAGALGDPRLRGVYGNFWDVCTLKRVENEREIAHVVGTIRQLKEQLLALHNRIRSLETLLERDRSQAAKKRERQEAVELQETALRSREVVL